MLQNRVDPWGELRAVKARGMLMGNRGILHDGQRQIIRQWAHQHWVVCLLEYREIKRPKPFSTPDNYSELFFLDEATAFSAGHRPCNHCQRERSQAFKMAWLRANVDPAEHSRARLASIDKILHGERARRGAAKPTYRTKLTGLPVGSFFEFKSDAYLVAADGYRRWAFDGYGPLVELSAAEVDVLTPRSVVGAFASGFVPLIHGSAGQSAQAT